MIQRKITPFLKGLFLFMSLYMIYLVIETSLKSNLFDVLPELSRQPWFMTTIYDFYFNITIISAWVLYKEKNLIYGILWVVSFIFLGSITTAFYIFLQLMKVKSGESVESVLLRKVE